MPDLKQLLRPLADREMPDRWDRIQRRPVEPIVEPHRSRTGAMVVAGLAATVTLVVVAALSPLGTGPGPGSRTSETQPPAWLVDRAYQMAYANGDITPDSASWIRSDADTIATAVGLQSGDPSVQRFLVVLRGHFTAFNAKGPSGSSSPKGSVLTFAVDPGTREVTDWGVGDQEVGVPGLQTFTLPDASQMYTSPQGWTVAVPPAWKSDAFSNDGTMIANTTLPAPSANDSTVWRATGFPLDGVAIAVTPAGALVPRAARVSRPPLSFDDFITPDSWTGSGFTPFTALVQGPNGRYIADVRIGRQASPTDRAAIEDVIASLTFEPSATGQPTTYNGVPVVYQTLGSPVGGQSSSGTFTQPSGTFTEASVAPSIPAEHALATAWGKEGSTPERIVVGSLEWSGSPSWKGGPVWLVSFQGGDVCVPIVGPIHLPAAGSQRCAGVIENSIIDATLGSWIMDFSNGPSVAKGTVVQQDLAQLFVVKDG